MEFQYALNKEEYMDYCLCKQLSEPTFKKLRYRAWPILPVILVLLIVAFFPVPWWAYLAAVALSLCWVILVNYLVVCVMKKAAGRECEKADEGAYQPIGLQFANGKLKVNGTRRVLKDYRMFSNLLLLFLNDDSCVVLPQRVFGESQEDFRNVVDQLQLCLKSK